MVSVSRSTVPGVARSSNLLGEMPAANPAAWASVIHRAIAARISLRNDLEFIIRFHVERVGFRATV